MIAACLVLVLGGMAQALDSVSIAPGVPVGYEANSSPATFVVTRSGSTGSLDVQFSVAGTATVTTDYAILPALSGASTGTVSFVQGETTKTITITPVDDALVEGRESVLISLVADPSYIIGASPSAQVDIADNDLTATIQVRDAIADEDTLVGLATDPEIRRRGVVRVQFSPISPASFDRTLTVQFGGRATQPGDYIIQHKIGGNGGATANLSQIGTDPSPGNLTTGLNYRVYAHLSGDTLINISAGSAAIANGAGITFAGDLTTYTVNPGGAGTNSSSANGPGAITISPALQRNLAPGAAVTVLGATPPTGFTVFTYPAGTTTLKLGDGPDRIFVGDVMTFGADPSTYVATSDMLASQGPVSFTRFTGGGTGNGLNLAIAAVTEVTTLFTTTVTGNLAQIRVPASSTRVDFSFAPVADGVVEGAEDITVTLVGDRDYAIQNPTVGTVLIADANAIATIALGSNAGKPNTSGSFLVTLSSPFPVPVTVPYSIVPGTTTAVAGVDYVALPGSLTIPAGQTSGSIAVSPLNTPANGLTTVTISLDNTLDYKLGGSGSSSTNPSASVNITDSLGVVSIAATTPLALENPTAPVPGAFTVSLVRNGPGAISVNYAVSGSAASGSRYVALSGTVNIPAGASTATIPVTPVDNLVADGNQGVVVTLTGGQGYSIDPLATGAQVTVVDDEPTVSVVAIADAIQPSTPGAFLVSYPGVPAGTALNRPVVVNYTFSGTAVAGTDFTGSSSVTIPAGSLSAQIPISPLGNAASAGKTVTVTLTSSSAYTIGTGTASLLISLSPQQTASQTKPAPGSIDTGKGTGCGHGSGFATLIGLALLGLGLAAASLRRNR